MKQHLPHPFSLPPGGVLAARAGHDVIMTPTAACYFDYRQADQPREPGTFYATLALDTVYAYDPLPTRDSVRCSTHRDTMDMRWVLNFWFQQ